MSVAARAPLQHIINPHTATQSAKVAYRLLTPNLTGRVVDAISESFGGRSSDDPFTCALKLTKKDWRDMCGMFVERAATQERSVVAVDTETQNVAGCIINEDWKENVPSAYRQLSPLWVCIVCMVIWCSVARKCKCNANLLVIVAPCEGNFS